MKDRIKQEGFTLIEVLAVIAIISLLALLTIPAVSDVQRSFHLSESAALIQDHLLLARQMAITRNEPIVLNLCKARDALGQESIRTLRLVRFEKNGDAVLIERPASLPEGFSIATDPTWSSVIQGSGDEIPIRFTPSGGTTLNASDSWFLTVFNHRKSAVPEDHFITLAIDPVTGRVFSYQP